MIQIRDASREDVPSILRLIKALAEYEREPNAVENTVADLENHLFEEKICNAFVAEDASGIIGFALYYTSYSTWKGKCLYLEDLYVQENKRTSGIGGLLFEKVVNTAKNSKVKRMEWLVLEWNEPAINFYKKHKASLDKNWITGKFEFGDLIK